MTMKRSLVVFVGSIGMIWYFACLFLIGLDGIKEDSQSFREFMSISLTTIATALATFVGAILGIKFIGDEIKKDKNGQPKVLSDRLSLIKDLANGTIFQWVAAFAYVISLIIAVILWWMKGDKADPTIISLGKSLLGLVAGVITALSNAPRTKED
jgi:hypothetical protein